jgi:hypothetical protein
VTPSTSDNSETPRSRRIRADQVRVQEGRILTSANHEHSGGLHVRPILENGVVRRIEVQCSCGQHMTVVCVYPEGANEPEGAAT